MPECVGSGDQFSLDRFVNTLADLMIKYQTHLNLEDLEGGNADGVSAPFCSCKTRTTIVCYM